MRKTMKWTLPAALAMVALVGWSFNSVVAQMAASKGKITVTVKGPDGALAANVPLQLLKGTVELPAGGRRGGGGGGGAPPASQPTPLLTGTTDDKGVYTFADVDAGDYTVFAGAAGGRGGGRRGGGGAGGPGAGGPPASAPAAGGGGRGAAGLGRGAANGTLKAGDELKLDITLVAGRGGRGGRRGGGGGGGGAPGGGAAAPGQGA